MLFMSLVVINIYEGHPESKDCLAVKKNKQNRKKKNAQCIIITDTKLFFYIVATNFQALL
jgi:hypothetical protein